MTAFMACQGCGMSELEWLFNEGEGFLWKGNMYCCPGCARGTGCACAGEVSDDEELEELEEEERELREWS